MACCQASRLIQCLGQQRQGVPPPIEAKPSPHLRPAAHRGPTTEACHKQLPGGTSQAVPNPCWESPKAASGLSAAQAGLPTLEAASSKAALAVAVAVLVAPLLLPDLALGLALHQEPANALSVPTWAVHISSLLEYTVAMVLIWQYGEVSGVSQWKGLTWAMLPNLMSAMCAVVWHWHYNSPELMFLRDLQALLSFIGSFTCWLAAYRIYKAMQQREA